MSFLIRGGKVVSFPTTFSVTKKSYTLRFPSLIAPSECKTIPATRNMRHFSPSRQL